MENDQEPQNFLSTLHGRLLYIESPGLLSPGEPGMSFALSIQGKYYYLYQDGRPVAELHSMKTDGSPLNGLVSITGHTRVEEDAKGRPVNIIEVISARNTR